MTSVVCLPFATLETCPAPKPQGAEAAGSNIGKFNFLGVSKREECLIGWGTDWATAAHDVTTGYVFSNAFSCLRRKGLANP